MINLTHLSRAAILAGIAFFSISGFAGDAQSEEGGENLLEQIAAPVLDLRPEDAPDMCDPAAAQVRVTVNGIEAYGLLTVELYRDDKDNFLSREGRMRRVRVAAEDGAQTVCLNVPGAGTYAVASYHDEDGDRKLDRKWTRLPKEPFALSNNPKLKLRKPRLREAAFQAGELGADIDLYLRGSRPDR